MAYRVRRARRRGGGTLGKWLKGKFIGIVFLAMATFVVGAIGLLTSLIPSTYIAVANGSLTVSSTLPAEGNAVDIKLIVALIGAFASVFLVLSGVRRLGIKM